MHSPSNIKQSHGTISFDLRKIMSPGNKSQLSILKNISEFFSAIL